jgi:Alpha-L-arabinofuranosidase C-terminal domain
MQGNSKITSFGLMITVLLLILLTGCDFRNYAKPNAVIAIDLSQPGKTFPKDLYGKSIGNTTRSIASEEIAKTTGSLNTALSIAAGLIATENNIDNWLSVSDSLQLSKPDDLNTKQGLKGDHHHSFYTPAYYALKLFLDNRPDKLMPVKVNLNGEDRQTKGLSVTAGIHDKSGIVIIKLVNLYDSPRHCRIVLNYKQQIKYKGEVIVLTSGNGMDMNSQKEPEKVVPLTRDVNGLRNTFNYECPANAIVIIHLRYKKGINGFVDCC